MAACSEERHRNRLSFGKDLPPITLSNTSIASLVSLIPVIVALTSRPKIPCFEDEKDKPVWWPDDIQWNNPKQYSAYMGDNILKLLRKVVESCYTYHGVEDLLCRLEEAPVMDEVVVLSDDDDNNSAENDNPVFVCCFCLEAFNSHELVSSHQRVCQEQSQLEADDKGNNASQKDMEKQDTSIRQQQSPPSSGHTDRLHNIPHPVSLSIVPERHTTLEDVGRSRSEATAASKTTVSRRNNAASSSSSYSNNRRPQSSKNANSTQKSVLKTRSQKKLDQIMDRHKKKLLMRKECRELKEVPKTGAWWVRKKKRKRRCTDIHPTKELSKNEFLSSMGLSLKVKSIQSDKPSSEVEVDLDCEIISVEGPLIMKPPPTPPTVIQESLRNSNTAVSPRATRSLMSQMSRDESSSSSRRRISLCFVEDEWADKEAIDAGRDPRQMCLLTLDLSSPLGKRIKKYAKADGTMNVVKDIELFCSTEMKDSNKLRGRVPDFRVTFKRKCRATSYVHTYKFNRDQVREFEKRVRTGLSSRSRYLKQVMPKCQIPVRKLTERDIELYNEEKKVTIAENIVVDDDLCITQIDIPESSIHLSQNRPPAPSSFSSSNPNPSHRNRYRPSPACHKVPPFKHTSSNSHSSIQPSRHQEERQQHHHQSIRNHPYSLPPYLRNRYINNKSHNHRSHLSPSSQLSSPQNSFLPLPLSNNYQSSNSNFSSVPPYIPNIFRNRANSNTPSPPLPDPKLMERRTSYSDFKKVVNSLQGSTVHHHPTQQQKHHPQQQHLHHHQQQQQSQQQNQQRQQQNDSDIDNSLPSSSFSTGVIISEKRRQKPSNNINSNNSRRKQPMNQVRHDDSSDKISPQNSLTARTPNMTNNASRNFDKPSAVNFDNNRSNYKNDNPSPHPSPSSSSSSSSLSSPRSLLSHQQSHNNRPQEQTKPLGQSQSNNNNDKNSFQDLSKLSNFDYFTIKQGKVKPGQSLLSPCSSPHSNNNSKNNSPPGKISSSSSGNTMSKPRVHVYSPPTPSHQSSPAIPSSASINSHSPSHLNQQQGNKNVSQPLRTSQSQHYNHQQRQPQQYSNHDHDKSFIRFPHQLLTNSNQGNKTRHTLSPSSHLLQQQHQKQQHQQPPQFNETLVIKNNKRSPRGPQNSATNSNQTKGSTASSPISLLPQQQKQQQQHTISRLQPQLQSSSVDATNTSNEFGRQQKLKGVAPRPTPRGSLASLSQQVVNNNNNSIKPVNNLPNDRRRIPPKDDDVMEVICIDD